MLKIALCDDNNIYIDELSKILKDISMKNKFEIEISKFSCGEDLFEFCENHKNYFDVLFLDILMGGINGIQTASKIRQFDKDVFIVFVTSSKEYALDSYSVNAYGYILKPFSYSSIEEKLINIKDKLDTNKKNIIYVKSNQDIISVNLNKVIYFESNLRKITAYLTDGNDITFYNKLNDMENQIDSTVFVRTHRSYLVNLTYIKNIIASDVITTTEEYIPISKKYLSDVKDNFTKYMKSKLLG